LNQDQDHQNQDLDINGCFNVTQVKMMRVGIGKHKTLNLHLSVSCKKICAIFDVYHCSQTAYYI